MCSTEDVRKIIKEEVAHVIAKNHEIHDGQHKEILDLIHTNVVSIKAIDDNTRQLVKLHSDASAVLRVTEKVGTAVRWLLIPVAGVLAVYEWGHHAVQSISFLK